MTNPLRRFLLPFLNSTSLLPLFCDHPCSLSSSLRLQLGVNPTALHFPSSPQLHFSDSEHFGNLDYSTMTLSYSLRNQRPVSLPLEVLVMNDTYLFPYHSSCYLLVYVSLSYLIMSSRSLYSYFPIYIILVLRVNEACSRYIFGSPACSWFLAFSGGQVLISDHPVCL